MIRAAPCPVMRPKLELLKSEFGLLRLRRLNALKKSARNSIDLFSKRGNFLKAEISSLRDPKPLTSGRNSPRLPNVNGLGTANAARFRYRSPCCPERPLSG